MLLTWEVGTLAARNGRKIMGRKLESAFVLVPGHQEAVRKMRRACRSSARWVLRLAHACRSDRRALAPGEAWEGRRDAGNTSKPFGGTQWAIEPTRQSLANGRKRVLRPGGATPRAKR